MCGIFGISQQTNSNKVAQKVYMGLSRLDYRGYDSWVIAVNNGADIFLEKAVGKIDPARSLDLPSGSVAIGHTRWATHGGVTQINAHPHLAANKSFAVAQNGVVENYQKLKTELISQGYLFKTQTDTEVIVALLETAMATKKESQLSFEIVRKVFLKLEGRNTIAVLTRQGRIMAIRQGSPLIVGRNERQKTVWISSDTLSLAKKATEYVALDHGQGVVIDGSTIGGFEVSSGEKIDLVYQPLDMKQTAIAKGEFPHFMLKEIYEQPAVFEKVAQQPAVQLEKLKDIIHKASHVYTLGAGSASFAAGQLAYWLRSAGVVAMALKSYEAASYRSLFSASDVCLVFSQSGETADTNEVAEWLHRAGVKVVSLVNMPGSTLTAMSDVAFMLQAGPEVGVASTKALTGQLLWSQLVVQVVLKEETLPHFQNKVSVYADQLTNWLDSSMIDTIAQLADKLSTQEHVFVLGRGQLYMPALEFALKIKEISYLHAEGFSGGELKHGVIALLEKQTPVVCLVADDTQQAAMMSAVAEVKAREARVIGVGCDKNDLYDDWLQIPDNKEFVAISSIIPAQLLTYYLAIKYGYDPDKPRNLAKSVTVK